MVYEYFLISYISEHGNEYIWNFNKTVYIKKCATYQTEYVFKANSFFGMFLYMHRKLNISIKNVEIL